ncbi:hypothetical protein QNI16_13600 [Cytophagaceae bacterium YF14B1]|uniref:Uncharacterized protein n=1 Tax=Xanthocytophaga flava TaxID=3048013 RepID=A0AAE3QQF0_9BACT|nr:hypothetical protein [Xanthocytophaga flavus]MDJ1481528.1 hypothetical protein [Xanthocytophaga flavus]
MQRTILLLLLASSLLFTCKSKNTTISRAFYYWQTHFDINEEEQKYMDSLHVRKLYVRFFDVSYNPVKGAVPLADLYNGIEYYSLCKQCDTIPAIPDSLSLEIVPTVFITNFTFEKVKLQDIPELASKVYRKLDQMITENTNNRYPKTFREIQFDCDWTQSTKEKFFLFLKEFKRNAPKYRISATIRLYQYKYFEKAGVPPVDRGMLMVYNLTDLHKLKEQNSILDIEEAKRYLTHIDYPLSLDIALPIFSWGIVFRNNKYVDIDRNINSSKAEQCLFLKKNISNQFTITTDTVYNNIYLREGDILKIEDISSSQLEEITKFLKPLSAKTDLTVTFFHLDEELLQKYKTQDLERIYTNFSNR